MIKKHNYKSCCGSRVMILETSKPIRKSQIAFFKEAGYLVPDNFYQAGVFYVQKAQLIATSSFGTTRIQVRCHGPDCDSKIESFEQILEKAINS